MVIFGEDGIFTFRGTESHIGQSKNLFFDILWCFWMMILYTVLGVAVNLVGTAAAETFGFESSVYVITTVFDFLLAAILLPVIPNIGKREGRHGAVIATLVVLVPVCWLISSVLCTLIYQYGDMSFTSYQDAQAAASPFWSILFTLIAAPVSEEMLFRGCFYGGLRRNHNVVVSAVVSSAFFAFAHGTLVHLPLTFLLGIVCCMAYEQIGDIRASMLVHIATNSLSMFAAPLVMLPEFMYEPVVIGALYLLCVSVAVAVSIVFDYLGRETRGGDEI